MKIEPESDVMQEGDGFFIVDRSGRRAAVITMVKRIREGTIILWEPLSRDIVPALSPRAVAFALQGLPEGYFRRPKPKPSFFRRLLARLRFLRKAPRRKQEKRDKEALDTG
jgi:hypothetical protein